MGTLLVPGLPCFGARAPLQVVVGNGLVGAALVAERGPAQKLMWLKSTPAAKSKALRGSALSIFLVAGRSASTELQARLK
jgi:hypothetical protein